MIGTELKADGMTRCQRKKSRLKLKKEKKPDTKKKSKSRIKKQQVTEPAMTTLFRVATLDSGRLGRSHEHQRL